MQSRGSGDGLLSQCFVEEDFSTMLAFDVKDGTFRNCNIQHFFEAHGLSTEMHFVVVPATFFATFEIDGIRDKRVRRVRWPERGRPVPCVLVRGGGLVRRGLRMGGRDVRAPEFHEIGFAGDSELPGHEHHAGDVSLVAAFEIRGLINLAMSVLAFGSVLVVPPDLLDQMQRQPPLAEQQIVEISQREKIVVSELRGLGQAKVSIRNPGTKARRAAFGCDYETDRGLTTPALDVSALRA